jgi:hypothetical protein
MKQIKKEEMPPKQRRSRKDKLHELLKEYLPPTPAAPTKFQSAFYEELIVCKGPFCQTIHRDLTPRVQAIGYMYKMYGGSPLKDDEAVKKTLEDIFAKVGLKMTVQ